MPEAPLHPPIHLPLANLRVIELSGGKLASCTRLLADLGAEVIVVEPPDGIAARSAPPLHEGLSLYFATHYVNKQSVVLDLKTPDGREAFLHLCGTADLLFETLPPGALVALDLAPELLMARKPGLVVMSATDFGQTGPYRDYAATNAVHSALAGVLCRSGLPGLPPLMPPGSLALEAAAVQAAWVTLLALWQQVQTKAGDRIDFSIYEAVAQVLDPGLGVTGSAQAGQSALDSTPHGRPAAMPLYPIIPCKDGNVRICVLAPRQWEAMSAWLGPDHEFTDPAFAQIATRGAVAGKVNALIGTLFANFTAADLVTEGQRRGVPIAAVATPTQVLQDEHFRARGAFTALQVAPGVTGLAPSGLLEIDGVRAGIRTSAPALGEHNRLLPLNLPEAAPVHAPAPNVSRRPLEGLRILDLGVIVAGAEAGRLLADQGAEVIKIENRAFPDGGRQSRTGTPMTPSIAQGHRNKLSLGINLRSAKGVEMFKKLVTESDAILSNFKSGTMEALGLGYDVLKQLNPRIIMVDSSALGNTGPQSRSMGYGPLVRATTGLSWLWRYPDVPGSFSDGVTIYPDHLAARVAVIGVLALLLRREQTGVGGTASVSQAEVFLNGNPEHYLRESLEPGSFIALGNATEFNVPESVFPCAGDDEWCVIAVRDDADWQRLIAVMGRADLGMDAALATMAGRIARRDEVNALVTAWTSGLTPREVTQLLQTAGVPAGYVQRLSEYRTDPQFTARGFIRTLEHPGLPEPLPTENRPAVSLHMPDPELRPAPYQAEHTYEIAARLLGLSAAEIEALIASGDLEDMERI